MPTYRVTITLDQEVRAKAALSIDQLTNPTGDELTDWLRDQLKQAVEAREVDEARRGKRDVLRQEPW